jgi:hypothetical protein
MKPPHDHPIYPAYVALDNAMQATSLADQVEAFKPALDIAAENIWTINISEAPPQLVVVADGFRNVPDNALYAALN